MTTFSRWSQLVRKNRLAALRGNVAIRKSGTNVAYGSGADACVPRKLSLILMVR